MSVLRTSRAWVMCLALCLTVVSVQADDEANVTPEGVAIHGYDPVAYFDPGVPVRGNASHSARHFGITYWFSSSENLSKFTQNPEKYTPSYGGWCSYGVRVGKKFDVDPNAFRVVDGRLFLQLDFGTQKLWKQDLAKNIDIADRLWPKIQSASAKALGE
ncbi:YHS domain-containing (seleno)protein [Thalassospiraceae bacterium LMO-JJ14]|nr:YHS domain-containing (seleno)protein [Thalassospiraceae bacterium LMO-JJ14]